MSMAASTYGGREVFGKTKVRELMVHSLGLVLLSPFAIISSASLAALYLPSSVQHFA
jgi:hypothetical protein